MAGRLFEAFLAGSTLGKGRFQDYQPEPTSFLPQRRTLLPTHTIPDLRALQYSVLQGGRASGRIVVEKLGGHAQTRA